jgi:hypothetical protein
MREIDWTPCCYGDAVFTIYRDHKVTRTVYAGTIVELLSSETGLPLEYTRRSFTNPAHAFNYLDSMGV